MSENDKKFEELKQELLKINGERPKFPDLDMESIPDLQELERVNEWYEAFKKNSRKLDEKLDEMEKLLEEP